MLQFILEFQLEKPQMPLEFDRLMVSFLKGASRNYSEDMFERLYDKSKSVIKTYTYSMYLPGARFMKETVELSENRFRMFFQMQIWGRWCIGLMHLICSGPKRIR